MDRNRLRWAEKEGELATAKGRLPKLLRVRGKGGDHRLIPVQPKLARRLRRFAEKGRPADAPDRLFFAVRRRPDGTLQALHESGVLQLVRSLGE